MLEESLRVVKSEGEVEILIDESSGDLSQGILDKVVKDLNSTHQKYQINSSTVQDLDNQNGRTETRLIKIKRIQKPPQE